MIQSKISELQARNAQAGAEQDLEDEPVAGARQTEHSVDLGRGEDAHFTHRLAGRRQQCDPAIGRVALGYAPAIEGTQDPVVAVEGRGSQQGPLGPDLAVEAMSGSASVALELLAQLTYVLALDLVDGADALAGRHRQGAALKEVAVPVRWWSDCGCSGAARKASRVR